jgi:hypothetical protein
MKTLILPLFAFAGLFFASTFASATTPAKPANADLIGAWMLSGDEKRVLVVTENYWSQTTFTTDTFLRTQGGTYERRGDHVAIKLQFDSADKNQVGKTFLVRVAPTATTLQIAPENKPSQTFTRLDTGDHALAGVWRINGRKVSGQIQEMPLRARRTLKILSGTRFQWVAMNIDTGEFSGTGGGTFTFENGRYVEKIDFFSRDNSRVGAELAFGGEVKGDQWRHHGLSSRGDPIDEVWIRFQP